MARRKNILEDGYDSDSSFGSEDDDLDDFNLNENADERAERELLERPHKRRRRRKRNGKDSTTYGIFGENSEDDEFHERGKDRLKRSDWTKAPIFTPGEKKVDIKEAMEDIETEESVEIDEEGSNDESDASESSELASKSNPPSPRVRMEEDWEDEMEARPRMSGIGATKPTASISAETSTAAAFASPGITSSGIGFRKGGIGARKIETESGRVTSESMSTRVDMEASLPSSFGARPQRAFVRDGSGSGPSSAGASRAATPLSTAEQLHFSKLAGTFGARMLAKMGWQAGTGLGTEGTGIVMPVESKLRPKNMGIAFKGFKEKTEQSKADARRRGEIVSEDEEEVPKRGKGKGKHGEQAPRQDAWKKPKKVKIKVEHKTYEEIIAEAGGEPPPSSIGKIIDATGATPREVSSLADVSIASWTPSTDSMRIPEVRHNLRLISEACKTDLDGLAREAKMLEDRKKWINSEDPRIRHQLESEAELIRKLQAVHLVVDDINAKAKELSTSDYEPTLEPFAIFVDKLITDYAKEYDQYRLDEIIVAAVMPTFQRLMATWRPLEEPDSYTPILRRWRSALKMTVYDPKASLEVDMYGAQTVSARPPQTDMHMTPYDSLMWNVWLPKVRSSINNEWSPSVPLPVVRLYEAWSDLLPTFIKDNLLDQLILPKISSAVSKWSPKRDGVSLQAIVFPWLPFVGLRMETFIDDARRKVKSMLRSWTTSEGVPKNLLPWKEVFNAAEWENMLLKYIVPKLGATLREDFRVNPRNQNLESLHHVLAWSDILRTSIIAQLLEAEFFPKWLDVLYIWLTTPRASFEEVAQWYSFWKGTFPERVRTLPAVEAGFTRGLQLINHALELGPDAPTKLPKPERARSAAAHSPNEPALSKAAEHMRPSRSAPHEVTFRAIVEEFAATHNLLFMPASRVHERTRLPLFRVARSVDGRGGLLVYLLDDAVWAPEPGVMDTNSDYQAITLEDMVLRATKGH